MIDNALSIVVIEYFGIHPVKRKECGKSSYGFNCRR